MAHKQQSDFCLSVKHRFGDYFRDRIVLDIGSLDINGNNQFLFEDCLYLGVDVAEGLNVDFVCKGHELQLPDSSFDVIISTECFEHDQYYENTLKNIYRLLKPGGLFVFTCATTGRPEHGTRRTSPTDAPLIQSIGDWGDYYKNLDENDIRDVLDVDALFSDYEFSIGEETYDLYFWGIKAGNIQFRSNYSNQYIAEQNRREKEQLKTRVQALTVEVEEVRSNLTAQIEEVRTALSNCEHELRTIWNSRSWRITKPLRAAAMLIRGEISIAHLEITDIRTAAIRAKNALSYIKKGDFSGLIQRLRNGLEHSPIDAIKLSASLPREKVKWGILSTPHTLFIAHLIAQKLRHHGWQVDISLDTPDKLHHNWYIVLCPQMFRVLPPADKRICFQLEQSISSRWFNKKYLKILESSLGVLDYNLTNIDFLSKNGICYPHVHYLPLGISDDYGESITTEGKSYDILFYGDAKSSPRRRKLLEALKRHFDVKVTSEIFGEDMQKLIKQARVVVNIHYYEGALLETPRIMECLSLGTPVVSESSVDRDEHKELESTVYFFEEGSSSDMIDVVQKALDAANENRELEPLQRKLQARFSFMFDRFLVAMGFLPPDAITQHIPTIDLNSHQVALSLPETIERRKGFNREKPDNCLLFDGIRYRPGWIGCALSYATLARAALAQDIDFLTIMEDDVLLPSDFEEKVAIVKEYLTNQNNDWDIYAGLIALHHPDVKILSVENYKGLTFVTLNKMTSMVFNIYRRKALQLLSNWSHENIDAETNTIDRFLENQDDLKIVVTLPFLVGHREEMHSTLWGIQNAHYLNMIKASESALQEKTELFLKTA